MAAHSAAQLQVLLELEPGSHTKGKVVANDLQQA